MALKCKTGGVRHKCAKSSGKKEEEGGGGEGGGGSGWVWRMCSSITLLVTTLLAFRPNTILQISLPNFKTDGKIDTSFQGYKMSFIYYTAHPQFC